MVGVAYLIPPFAPHEPGVITGSSGGSLPISEAYA